jgi:hypothetical protein
MRTRGPRRPLVPSCGEFQESHGGLKVGIRTDSVIPAHAGIQVPPGADESSKAVHLLPRASPFRATSYSPHGTFSHRSRGESLPSQIIQIASKSQSGKLACCFVWMPARGAPRPLSGPPPASIRKYEPSITPTGQAVRLTRPPAGVPNAGMGDVHVTWAVA